jgi:hypothetical protein
MMAMVMVMVMLLAPPPPKADTQIVKLKWVPTQLEDQDPKEHGVWQGAFAVQLGTNKSSTVLQECGLLPNWVESVFAPAFRNECKNIAVAGGVSKRNPHCYLFIPAGDVKDTDADTSPPVEILTCKVQYQQGVLDLCLQYSMASALAAMGFVMEAKMLADQATLSGCNVELMQCAAAVVRKVFATSNLVLAKLQDHACAVAYIVQQDSTWPIVLVIQTSDGSYGTHAITL